MHNILYPVIASILVAAPAAASACAVFSPPGQRIERAMEARIIDAVAIMRVTDARHVGAAAADMHPWRANAALETVLQGRALPAAVAFERGWGSAACEWNLPALPRRGDRWVVYFWRDGHGKLKPWLTMPLAEAKIIDPERFTRGR